MGDVRGKHVLDVACGQGFFSRALASIGASVTGVDIALELIQIAKKLGPSSISYLVSPASRIPLPEESFDSAICVLALQTYRDFRGLGTSITPP